MCGLCGVLANEHWAEAGGDRRSRVFRAALLDRVLAQAGLDAQEWGGQYVVRDRVGRSVVVLDLAGVWTAAEQLAGRRLDPLDPSLLRALS
jgi:hypothetical protein